MEEARHELCVGTRAPERTFGPISCTDIVRYAGASGDFNPIHHDASFAVEAGFPTVFSMGMLPAGILASYVTDWLGVENLRQFAVRFRGQVWPGDVLTCAAVVAQVDNCDSGSAAQLTLVCRRHTGDHVLVGTATFVFHRDERVAS